ncbi:YlzJ-like family protein [Pseudalkalibacillus caeni]|uniref:Uncharacterized protein n=1 Tax=Exobacillus caeni TaxID=2574798 RepID=A0A5R9FCK9_9BACL|nr:YlzJ-like family protein [Pseudalkalibacillus caeni]TLS37385.1 hypothetical protein FCL54_09535 [Pseudalkalibacillus caeni]
MILYTIMPHDAVFPVEESEYSNQSVIEWNGVQLLVERHSLTQCRIIQVLSTNPEDFMNVMTQPGQMLSMEPVPEKQEFL